MGLSMIRGKTRSVVSGQWQWMPSHSKRPDGLVAPQKVVVPAQPHPLFCHRDQRGLDVLALLSNCPHYLAYFLRGGGEGVELGAQLF